MAALPVAISSAPPQMGRRPGGALQTMSLQEMDTAEAKQREVLAASQTITPLEETGLAGIIRRDWDIFQRHRDTVAGWSGRLLSALRQFNRQYEPTKLSEIRQFGGSEIYAGLTAMKCRGASSLLRDVYLTEDQPWGFSPPADPEIPISVFTDISTAVQSEIQNQTNSGQPPSVQDVHDRTMSLIEAAREAAKKKAVDRTEIAEDKIQTLLTEGGYYDALGEVLTDIAIFPFACLKGPVVKMVPVVRWHNGTPYSTTVPRLTWTRVSPFDLWFSPGVSDIENATVIERLRLTRAQLNDLLDLPGYNHDNVKEVLRYYGRGYTEAPDFTDSQRAVLESRENPTMNETGLIDCLEYHGNVQGETLLAAGMEKRLIPDPMRDYAVEVWLIGRYVIKLQLSPSPRKRHPYFIASFEKVPGTPVGNALPDIIGDFQDAANASLRALTNNMAMASGPQVVVHDDRLSGMENGEQIFPWKRWHVVSDPLGAPSSGSIMPVEFFQPQSNVQENSAVFQLMYSMSDDASAIPRYLQGSGPGGGAGRTASGLAMLMGNASKVLQTVCANVDGGMISPSLSQLLDIVLLTDTTDILDGTEKIVVRGVQVAMQRETMRSRQLEFLQVTANPMDAQIMGPGGRAEVLRQVSKGIGMPGAKIVPSEEEMAANQKKAAAMAQNQGIPGHATQHPEDGGGAAPGASGSAPPQPTQDMGPRTSVAPARIAGGVG